MLVLFLFSKKSKNQQCYILGACGVVKIDFLKPERLENYENYEGERNNRESLQRPSFHTSQKKFDPVFFHRKKSVQYCVSSMKCPVFLDALYTVSFILYVVSNEHLEIQKGRLE